MPLVSSPKEVLEMGRVTHDADTGEVIFPKTATQAQIQAYRDWHDSIKEKATPKIET